MSIEMIEEATFNQGTQIKVIGVGGGGGNASRSVTAADGSAMYTRGKVRFSIGSDPFQAPIHFFPAQ